MASSVLPNVCFGLAGGFALVLSSAAELRAAEPAASSSQGSNAASSSVAESSLVAQKPSPAQPAPGSRQHLTPAQQVKGLYLTAGFGANWPQAVDVQQLTQVPGLPYDGFQDNHNSGFSVETGLGYDFGNFRAEATYAYDASYLNNYTDQFGTFQYVQSPYVNKQSFFLSAYWDVNLKSRFSPYVGAGLGYSNLSASSAQDQFGPYSGYSGGALAYQFKAGLSYLLDKRSDLFAEAVYRGMNGYPVNDNGIQFSYSGYSSWGFQLGARYRF